MRSSPIRQLPAALLCAGALFALCAGVLLAAACNRNGAQPQAEQAPSGGQATTQQAQKTASEPATSEPATSEPASSEPNAPGAAGQPRGNELGPEPRSVTLGNPPPAGAPRRESSSRQGGTVADAGRSEGYPQQGGTVADAPGTESYPRQRGAGAAAPRTAEPMPVMVPAGTRFEVELTSGLSTSTSFVGQTCRARVVSPVYTQGLVAIPGGSEVVGVVTRASGTRRVGGRAVLGLRFTELVLPSGATVPIRASFVAAGRSKTGRDVAIIGGSAAGGAIIGHHVGGNRDRGTVIGGLLGAAVGTAVAANTPGRPAALARGSVLRLRLRSAVEVPAYR